MMNEICKISDPLTFCSRLTGVKDMLDQAQTLINDLRMNNKKELANKAQGIYMEQ